MSHRIRQLLSMTLLLAVILLVPYGCEAQAGASTSPAAVPVRAGQTIERGDDAAAILGRRAAERNLGTPAPLNRKQRTMLEHVYTEPGELPQLTVDVDGETLELPLRHTDVKATIAGYAARVEVTQTYHNPFAYPIEAIYIFPLPENSAVDDMKIKIGDRVIEAEIQKRAEARQTYETAKRQGHTAALLEQERPNIFTQSVIFEESHVSRLRLKSG